MQQSQNPHANATCICSCAAGCQLRCCRAQSKVATHCTNADGPLVAVKAQPGDEDCEEEEHSAAQQADEVPRLRKEAQDGDGRERGEDEEQGPDAEPGEAKEVLRLVALQNFVAELGDCGDACGGRLRVRLRHLAGQVTAPCGSLATR